MGEAPANPGTPRFAVVETLFPTSTRSFSVKTVALLLGIVLLALGVAGFVPALNPGGQLFGLFPMDLLMSALFAVTGAIGIAIGLSARRGLTPPSSAGSTNDMRPWV